MSTIDDRIVRMEFDNKQFESGVSETMSTLQKLKMALEFRGSNKGMDDVQRAANSMNFDAINGQIYRVQERFSFFGEFVKNIFDRLSNRVIDFGSKMTQALTTDPLKSGFSEYELQMDSTQTIMSSTGASIETVSKKLDELNTYADKTRYSFSDMTANIGKFTNAGVSLDDAVAAIQGVSNEAALSGANAAEASRAMYNFSQALSSGAVKLIDWKSIENANMATQGFKNELIATAKVLGTVVETEDGFVSTTTDLNGKVSDAFTATKGFNDSLSAQWLTTDVLTETLKHYSTDVRTMTDAERESYRERLRNLGYTDEQIKGIEELGKKAFDSAQDVKTFSQLIDTVKESLGSGWTKSFQYMVGNLEEATVLWTSVNKEISSVLDPIADAREEMLKFWHDNGGRDKAIEAITNAWEGVKSVMGAVSEAFRTVFPPMTGERLVEITETVRKLSERFKEFATSGETINTVRNVFVGLFTTLKGFFGVAWSVLYHLNPVIKAFATFGSNVFSAGGDLGVFIEKILGTGKPLRSFTDIFTNASDIIHKLVGAIEELIKSLLDFVGIHIEGNPLTQLIDSISGFVTNRLNGTDFSLIDSLGSMIRNMVSGVTKGLSGLLNFGLGGLGSFVDTVLGLFDNMLSGLGESLSNMGSFSDTVIPVLRSVFNGIVDVLKGASGTIVDLAKLIGDNLPKILDYFGSPEFRSLVSAFTTGNLGLLIGSVRTLIDTFTERTFKGPKVTLFSTIEETVKNFGKSVGATFEGLQDSLSDFQTSVKASTLVAIAIALGVLAGSIVAIASVDADRLSTGIMGIAAGLAVLIGAFKTISASGGIYAFGALPTIGSNLVKIAASIAILAYAVKSLSQIKMEELEVGFTGLVGILGAVLVATKLMPSRETTLIAKGLIRLAVAVRLLIVSVKSLAKLPLEDLQKGLGGVTALLAALALFDVVSTKGGLTVGAATSFVLLAASLKILESVVTTFASLNATNLVQGLGGVAALLLSISALSVTLDKEGLSIRAAVSILTTVAAIKVLEGVVQTFASMNQDGLIRGLEGVAGLLLSLTLFIKMLGEGGASITAAASVGILALAISTLLPIVDAFAGMSNEGVARALAGLAVSLISVATAIMALGSGSAMILAGAAALVIASVGITVLAKALTEISKIKTEDLIKALGGVVLGLTALAAGLALLGLASPLVFAGISALALLTAIAFGLGVALTALAAGISALSAAFTLSAAFQAFATGLDTVGAAMKSFGSAFAYMIVGLFTNMEMIGSALVHLIASVFLGIGNGIIGALEAFANGFDRIARAVTVIIHALGELLVANIPYILGVAGELLTALLDLGIRFVPQISMLLMIFISTVVAHLVSFIPVLSAVLVNGAISLINSLANGIRENAEPILAAIRNILSSIIELMLTSLSELVRMIPGVGDMLADQIDKGKEAVRKTLAPETFEASTKDALDGAAKGIEAGGAALENASSQAGQASKDAVAEKLSDGESISGEFVSELVSGFAGADGEFADAGSSNLESYIGAFSGGDSGDVGTTIAASIAGDMASNSELFTNAGELDLNAFLTAFNSPTVGAAGSEMASTAATGAGKASGKFTSNAQTVANSFKTALARADTASAGRSLASSGARGAGSMSGSYASTGRDVAYGFNWNGVASGAALTAARSAGSALGSAALAGIKAAVRSGSPSREAMKIGRWTTQGFAIGIDSLSKLVYDESVGVGNRALDGIRDSVAAISKYIDSDAELDPTIRPVLDLTEIQNGLSKADTMVGKLDRRVSVGMGGLYRTPRSTMNGFAQMLADQNAQALSAMMQTYSAGDVYKRSPNIEVNVYGVTGPDEVADAVTRKLKLLGSV